MKVILEKYFETIRKLFLGIGIKSITMDDICNELGMSKKTLYKEYTDKRELVTEVFLRDFYDFKTKLISAQKNSPDAVAETCILFKLIAEKNFREDIEPPIIAAIVSFIFNSIIMLRLNNNTNNSISLSDSNILNYHLKSICNQQGLELWLLIKCNKTSY